MADKQTCEGCLEYHLDSKTGAIFCTEFNTFLDNMERCNKYYPEEPEDHPVTKDSDTPAHPTANGMTCRDCAMCEELEPDTWYCAQYGSLMDEDNMQPCMHFIFDSELKKEMFSDGSLTCKT